MNSTEKVSFITDLYKSKRIGNYKPINGTRRLIGPDWRILAASFTLILVPSIWVYLELMINYNDYLSNFIQFVVWFGWTFVDLYILVDAGTTDSGIIPKSSYKVNNDLRYFIDTHRSGHGLIKLKTCKTCNIVRPPRSFHCKKCDSWIEVHDHHWPWTGTWIGRRTHKK